ncbi:hypothetical protein ACS0TY_023248 [Phlomoides rotata]
MSYDEAYFSWRVFFVFCLGVCAGREPRRDLFGDIWSNYISLLPLFSFTVSLLVIFLLILVYILGALRFLQSVIVVLMLRREASPDSLTWLYAICGFHVDQFPFGTKTGQDYHGLIRDHLGALRLAFHTPLVVTSSFDVELQALLHGLYLARRFDAPIWIELNSLVVVHLLQTNRPDPWQV